jgi:hypothetical protein
MKILLTATVRPQVNWDLHVQDPGVRRRQYLQSVRRWLPTASRHGATVVLVENSGEDLHRLAKDAFGTIPANLRLVNAEPPTRQNIDRGKGAAEATMMDGFADAFFEDPDEVWFKCTGRLFVRNFEKCVPGDVPSRSIVGRAKADFSQLDTRFLGATAGAWRDYFVGAGPLVRDRDEMFLEKVLMKRTLSAMGDGVRLLRFSAQPDFIGRSATHADRRYDSLWSRIKRVGANKLEDILKGSLAGKYY